MILAPEDAPEWARDRAQLWNQVEAAEVRKDAQLAREMDIALPSELTHEQRRELIKSFVEEQFKVTTDSQHNKRLSEGEEPRRCRTWLHLFLPPLCTEFPVPTLLLFDDNDVHAPVVRSTFWRVV